MIRIFLAWGKNYRKRVWTGKSKPYARGYNFSKIVIARFEIIQECVIASEVEKPNIL